MPPVDTSRARNDGYRDGFSEGQREGREQGLADGRFRGSSEGESAGYRQCSEDLARRERERGRTEGYRDGSNEGDRNGRERGAAEGRINGASEGRTAGVNRAQSEALIQATPPGAAQGREEAERSDASARGSRDGLAQGEIDARADAVAQDLPRGHQAVRDEMWAEAVQSHDQFSQLGPRSENPVADAGNDGDDGAVSEALSAMLSRLMGPNRDSNRNDFALVPQRYYPTPEERLAYQEGYQSGRQAGHRNGYDEVYRRAYQQNFEQGRINGCRRAEQKSYREDYDRGYQEGRSEGYDRAYRFAYNDAYRTAYDPVYRAANDRAFNENYDTFYHRAFEEARARAFEERTGQLYRTAFSSAHDARYAAVRPGFGEEEYQRGRRAEASDFQQRPVRLIDASVSETNGNGLFEPEEPLRLGLKLRNFSTQAIDPRQVSLQVNALDENSVILSSRVVNLAQGLKAKSITTVTDAFELLVKDIAVGRIAQVQLKVLFGDRIAGEKTLNVQTQYALQIALTEPPAFRNGLETTIKFNIKNVSAAATEPNLRVRLSAEQPDTQVSTPEQMIQGLAPGESRIVEFPLVTRTSNESVNLPLGIVVQGGRNAIGSGLRTIGKLEMTQLVPVISDYKINLLSVGDLRRTGGTKIIYQIQNLNSENANRNLYVNLSIPTAQSPEDFTLLGTYPLELIRIYKGGAVKLKLPVNINKANNGGYAELQLMEGNKLLLIHRYQF